ncbi:MAG: FKBP-type peptidyl-prolyl cis-trans isomerase [Tepidisphaeraceae bacterium]
MKLHRTLLAVASLATLTAGSWLLAQPLAPNATPATAPAPTGLQIENLGRADLDYAAKTGDTVTVLYTGKLVDGTVFDSSFANPDMPRAIVVTLGAGRVIKGWEQGLIGMKLGESRKLTIPPDLAYGDKGSPPTVPPNATLNFEVTVVKIDGKK